MIILDDKTTGAWLHHHGHKLGTSPQGAVDFQTIATTGHAMDLLASLAREKQTVVPRKRVEAYANELGLLKLYLDPLLKRLERARLIEVGSEGDVEVIGVTLSSVLSHGGKMFEADGPSAVERAAIAIAERTSQGVVEEADLAEWIGDEFKLSDEEVTDFLKVSRHVQFVDHESLDRERRLYFNGNLFRRNKDVSIQKLNAVLTSLDSNDSRRVRELEAHIRAHGCLAIDEARKILGGDLFKKLQSIGLYDVNEFTNPNRTVHFVTHPMSFDKYGPDPFLNDALDMAKMLVSCLTYGRTMSTSGRGKIQSVKLILDRLNSGGWLGDPWGAIAIGQDYQVLERRGVVETKEAPARRGHFSMRLLKPEVGQLAAAVLTGGDGAAEALTIGSSATGYAAPEAVRSRIRADRKDRPILKAAIAETLNAVREGFGR